MSLHKRVDKNQPEIVKALCQIGVSVQHCGFRGKNFIIEIKNEDGKLTPDQKNWNQNWRGQKAICRTVAEALDVVTRT